MDISNIIDKINYIAICQFAPINNTFHKKKNLDKNYPYNGLENDIDSLRKEGNIFLLIDFNVRKTTMESYYLKQ